MRASTILCLSLAAALSHSAFAQVAPGAQAGAGAAPHDDDDGRRLVLDELGLVGGLALLEAPSRPLLIVLPGGPRGTGTMHMRGAWTGAQTQFAIWPWLRLGGRIRMGSLSYGPRIAVVRADFPRGTDFGALDPQLGDPQLGGSIGFLLRFTPGHFALDLGFTRGLGALRYRSTRVLDYATQSNDDNDSGQTAYRPLARELTFRFSHTGRGLFYGIAVGESFVNLPQPGFEALLGWRTDDYHVSGGLGWLYGPGLAIGVDKRLTGKLWLGLGALEGPGFTGALSLTQRWSDEAPL
jgi:hypothetical protein